MSVSDDIRAELDAANQSQAQEELTAQAQLEAATQYNPKRFADPTRDHIDHFSFVESRGFLKVFLESILVNFGPNPDPYVEAALQRDIYFSATGFKNSDPADDRRMEFARIADTNAPPPIGRSNDLSEKIAPVSNFSRGNGREVNAVYENFDEIYGERLASAAREVQNGFSQAAANIEPTPAQPVQNNYAAGLSTPAAQP